MMFNYTATDYHAAPGKGGQVELGDTARRTLISLVAAGNRATTRAWLQKHLPRQSGLKGHRFHRECMCCNEK